jgi:hypothetical protein
MKVIPGEQRSWIAFIPLESKLPIGLRCTIGCDENYVRIRHPISTV